MLGDPGPLFLAALAASARERFGADSAFARDCEIAEKTADVALARRSIAELPPTEADALMAAVHRRLAFAGLGGAKAH